MGISSGEARRLHPRPLAFSSVTVVATNLKGLTRTLPRITAGWSHAYLSAGVKDRRLGPRRKNSAGGPDREALPLRQLDGLRQDQGLLPGAVPRQRQLGARQWHRQLLTTGTVRRRNGSWGESHKPLLTHVPRSTHPLDFRFLIRELKQGLHTVVKTGFPSELSRSPSLYRREG